MAKLLGIGAAAHALGVHINTLRSWADSGKIPSERTTGGQRRFDVEAIRAALAGHHGTTWRKRLPLTGLHEDQVWRDVIDGLSLNLSEPAGDIAPYAFTEMLNNAIDHSQGRFVEVSFDITPHTWDFSIADDGIGVFKNLMISHRLTSLRDAVGELTKGKQTTAPEKHSGEGIFFTSKAVSLFILEGNGQKWIVDNTIADWSLVPSERTEGTRVECRIKRDTNTRLIDVFKEFTLNHNFQKSRPLVKLYEFGTTFISRSEAKRLMAGLENFSEIDLDFSDVISVGQGFTDEVFRVWQASHPTIKLHPINMSSEVEFMVSRARQ